jgi:bacterial/archaeal transporter family protein
MQADLPLWYGYTLLTFLLWGLSGITQKLATNHLDNARCFIAFVAAMALLSFLMPVFFSVSWQVSASGLFLLVINGTLNGAGAYCLFIAMERGGKASVVTAIAALYPVITVVLSTVFLKESLTIQQLLAIFFACLGAVLLSQEKRVI